MKKRAITVFTITILTFVPMVCLSTDYHNRNLDDENTRGTVIYEDMDNGIQAEEEETAQERELRRKREIEQDNKRIQKHGSPDYSRMNSWFIP